MFELAQNPAVQELLHQKVKETVEQNESMDYCDLIINNIPYLDAVVKETLRKYPPLAELTRQVTVDKYQMKDITLKKDTVVIVPSYAIHHCPDYYPDPEKFDPNRFMPENKHLLVPNTYMPFGQGPRNCIGMRFAYQELNLCLARLALKYQFHLTPNTPTKMTFSPIMPILRSPDYQLKLSKRD